MKEEILGIIRKEGLLLDKEIYDLLDSFEDVGIAQELLGKLQMFSGQKFITKKSLTQNYSSIKGFVGGLPGQNEKSVEKIFINLGLSLEITREKETSLKEPEILEGKRKSKDYQVYYSNLFSEKKLEVKDFVGLFRTRYQQLQKILMQRGELQKNLISINKISSDRSSVSIIGILKEKGVTKNKNLMLTFEDMTGEIKALVKFDNEEIFSKAEELQLDEVVGIKASGSRDILFVHDIFQPDAFIHEKMKFENDVSIAFLSDTHCGSDKHLGKNFEMFLDWLNGGGADAKKIKYLFFLGDNVDGVGIFPGQENSLRLRSMNEQYDLLASYLRRVPKEITMFMCPGQHDAARLAEPQPLISRKYAPGLYELDNLILVSNPAMIKLKEGEKEFKVLMYHGGSIHTFINEVKSLRMMDAHKCPAKALGEMLKRRHLAPMYGVSRQIIYIPNVDVDPLLISEVPDVLCTGEVHRLDIENYNGVLCLTGSCWQGITEFEEKVGNIPDPCKVPVLNLKSRELKIFDFSEVDK